jgi:hypothetical protein
MDVILVLLNALLKRWMRSMRVDEQEKVHNDFQQRLANPNLVQLEKYFGSIPNDLRALYGNLELLKLKSVVLRSTTEEQEYFIRSFLPADRQTLRDYPIKKGTMFPIAQGVFGKIYAVGIDQHNVLLAPVYLLEDDNKKSTKIAESLQQFLSWPATVKPA